MNDILVSIRIPESLLDEVKKLTKEEHFMDVSEGIRTIVRDKWLEYQKPELFHLKKIRKDIQTELTKKSKENITKEVLAELSKIKEVIKNEGI